MKRGVPVTIHLIDASPYIFRAFHSLPKSLTDPQGRMVNAVYGFASFLVKYLVDERPTHAGVAFDQNLNSSFRNELLATYKATRHDTPAELEQQLPLCLEVAQALGLATFIDPDYEADDLIASIIERTRTAGRGYVVVTVDKDLSQLVGDDVTLYDPGKSVRLDADGVRRKYGVRPDQITDWVALAGDSVDNIPGVAGIGPSTAADLLNRYGSLEGVYANLDDLRKRGLRARSMAMQLAKEVQNAGLSKRLATLASDAPVQVSLRRLAYGGVDEESLKPLFTRLIISSPGWRRGCRDAQTFNAAIAPRAPRG